MHTYHIPLPLEYFGEAEYEDVADDVSRVAHRQRRHQLVENVLLPREPGDDGSIAHQAHTPDGNLQWAEDLFFPRVLNIFKLNLKHDLHFCLPKLFLQRKRKML